MTIALYDKFKEKLLDASIDVIADDIKVVLVDTAGIRRRAKVEESIEKFSIV